MDSTRGFLYISLLVIYLPLGWFLIYGKMFFRSPLYFTYFFSVFLLNIVGSCVVFFPVLNIYGDRDLFVVNFYIILVLQACFFYIFTPFFSTIKVYRPNSFAIKSSYKFVAISIFVLCFIVILFLKKYGLPPLYLSDISGGNAHLISLRSNFFNNVDKFWFFRIGFYILPEFIGMVSYLLYREKQTRISLILFVVVMALSTILALSFLHKTPVVILWASILFAKVIHEKRFKIKLVFKWIVIIFGIVFVWYLIYFPGRDFNYYSGFMILSILNRVFGSYPLGLAAVFPVVEANGFFLGGTMNNPMGILPVDSVNFARLIHLDLFGIAGEHPPPAIGYAFADFGWFGVIVTLFFINFCLFILQISINKIKNPFIYIGLISYLSLRVLYLAMSSASEILLNPSEVITVFIIFAIYAVSSARLEAC